MYFKVFMPQANSAFFCFTKSVRQLLSTLSVAPLPQYFSFLSLRYLTGPYHISISTAYLATAPYKAVTEIIFKSTLFIPTSVCV